LAKDKPSEWLRNKQANALIAEMLIAGIPAFESKQQTGTYVAKELVYAYAMWISPPNQRVGGETPPRFCKSAVSVGELKGVVSAPLHPQNAVAKFCKSPRTYGIDSVHQVRQMTIIPERDVYRLVMN
jgi:hypothetical protein